MDSRTRTQFRAAELHYEQGETMESVARQLNVSRSTVSRLLKDARESGMVRITLVRPPVADPALTALADHFGVDLQVVAPPRRSNAADRLALVADAGAHTLTGLLEGTDGQLVGLAWGTTLNALVERLDPTPAHCLIVQLNGAANPSTSGIPAAGGMLQAAAEAFSGSMMHFPLPAFFDDPSTRTAMWRERSIQRVLAAQDALDIAVFSVGALHSPVRSRVYSAGYLSEADVRELIGAGVVGDVCTVFLRADGSHTDLPLNARASGMTPDRLRRVPVRLCVASGRAKAAGVLAALRANVVPHLVIDTDLARGLVRLGGRFTPRTPPP